VLAELASAVREGRRAPRELVERAYERIDRLNGPINAVISLRDPEIALAEADSVDRTLPLAGIPLLVKDNEHVAGMRTTFGSPVCADAPLEREDGWIPRKLRAAGAVVVGKTNVPEFTFEGFTDNEVFGPTRNPWSLQWSPGGSSGGSAAAMAAGIAPIGTGTDGGGSVRIPAALCGIVGLKPTNGVIAREPIPAWIDLSTYGPLGTSVADVRLLLDLEAGPAPGDPTALPYPLRPAAAMPTRVFASPRISTVGAALAAPVDALFRDALRRVETDLGLPVEPVDPERILGPGDPFREWFVTCAFEHLYAFGGPERVRPNLERFGSRFRSTMEAALRIDPAEYMEARRRRFDHARHLDVLLGQDAVLVTPTLALDGWLADGTAPDLGRPAEGAEGYNTDPLNITGHPAMSVPAGVCPNGVPFGLQIVGPRFADDLVLEIGQAWERAHPWPRAAPGYDAFDVSV
jgi:Asp-tRNA(Asn)/Glu-tRNA(Gln) amidotransferase A subunit family amidase